ncbi:hypothetical protein [Elizabethkingia phage TCUEAP1]|nr:hypothetical protein [Elizabethkingia phage TCUEAP1]
MKPTIDNLIYNPKRKQFTGVLHYQNIRLVIKPNGQSFAIKNGVVLLREHNVYKWAKRRIGIRLYKRNFKSRLTNHYPLAFVTHNEIKMMVWRGQIRRQSRMIKLNWRTMFTKSGSLFGGNIVPQQITKLQESSIVRQEVKNSVVCNTNTRVLNDILKYENLK